MQVKKQNPHFQSLQGRYTYAIRCMEERPVKKMLRACRKLFFNDIEDNHRKDVDPIAVFALGPAVLQAFDLRIGRYSDIQGQFVEAQARGKRVVIYPSLSKRQLLAKTGYYDILLEHIRVFMDALYKQRTGFNIQTTVPVEELTKDYIYPKTLTEVQHLVDLIASYSSDGKDPHNHVISIDTETNTLYPHREKLKILSLVVAWDNGKAASIPIEHPETPWTLEQVHPLIAQLLESPKPKIFHNAKFDLQVLTRKGWNTRRFAWDTLLGEHLLAEDKKGFYGLKPLVKVYLPKYAGYEDQLHELLKTHESASQVGQLKTEDRDRVSKMSKAEQKLAKDTGFYNIPLAELNTYGAIDADVTRQLYMNQRERMRAENLLLTKKRKDIGTSKYFRDLVQPLTSYVDPLKEIMMFRAVPVSRVLAGMELYGVPVDSNYIEDLVIEMDRTIHRTKIALGQMVPHNAFEKEFNPNSASHLRKVLFGTGFKHPDTGESICYRGIITPPTTSTGLYSTNAQFLRSLKSQHSCPFAAVLLEYRAIVKARSTFVENIRVLSREDGRMHTTYHVNGTSTGRLSSSNENMQNIPTFIGEHNIKKMFVPSDRENMVIVNIDAKAAEVRLYAAYSGDIALIQALNDGMDPHSFFSAMVYKPSTILVGVPPEHREAILQLVGIDEEHDWSYDDFQNISVFSGTKEAKGTNPEYGKRLEKLRKNMKRVVFGILYGASSRKVSEIVGIPMDQAQTIIDALFRMFPTIPQYVSKTKEQIQQLGMVETFIGRRRRLNLAGLPPKLQAKAMRQAVNFKIQSNSSDIVMDVLCDIQQPVRKMGGQLLITVHDSIVFELPKIHIHMLPRFVEEYGTKRIATKYPWLPVPFKWDVTVGPSYGEQMPVPVYLEKHQGQQESLSIPANHDDYLEHEIKQDFESLTG